MVAKRTVKAVVVKTPQGPRKVGTFDGSTFFKHVKRSKHLFRKYSAWGVDTRAVEALKKVGCRDLVVHDTESGIIYRAPFAMMDDVGFRDTYDFGDQTFIALAYFTEEQDDEQQTGSRWADNKSAGRSPEAGKGCKRCGG